MRYVLIRKKIDITELKMCPICLFKPCRCIWIILCAGRKIQNWFYTLRTLGTILRTFQQKYLFSLRVSRSFWETLRESQRLVNISKNLVEEIYLVICLGSGPSHSLNFWEMIFYTIFWLRKNFVVGEIFFRVRCDCKDTS